MRNKVGSCAPECKALHFAERQMEYYRTRALNVSGAVGLIPFEELRQSSYCLNIASSDPLSGFIGLCVFDDMWSHQCERSLIWRAQKHYCHDCMARSYEPRTKYLSRNYAFQIQWVWLIPKQTFTACQALTPLLLRTIFTPRTLFNYWLNSCIWNGVFVFLYCCGCMVFFAKYVSIYGI